MLFTFRHLIHTKQAYYKTIWLRLFKFELRKHKSFMNGDENLGLFNIIHLVQAENASLKH
jgi:hypothetical protein